MAEAAQQGAPPTFKLVLVGDGGTGKASEFSARSFVEFCGLDILSGRRSSLVRGSRWLRSRPCLERRLSSRMHGNLKIASITFIAMPRAALTGMART